MGKGTLAIDSAIVRQPRESLCVIISLILFLTQFTCKYYNCTHLWCEYTKNGANNCINAQKKARIAPRPACYSSSHINHSQTSAPNSRFSRGAVII